ncbi:MAG: transporter permease [Anaerocolumna sp.]|jgi:ABC-2 type transport system permease protein|nr:transporter permease [Anaerocolumna sp.]
MKKLKRYIYLYWRFISQDLKRLLEYQLDFFIQLIATFLMQFAGLVTIWGIFTNIQEIHGWGYWEIVLVYSMMYFSIGFAEIFFEGPWSINNLYLQGKMDYMLVKPLPVVFQIFASKIGLHGIGNVLTASIILVTAFLHVSDHIPLLHVLICLLLFIIALPIKGAIILAANCITFWTKAPGNAFGNFIHTIGEYTKYPITIYPKVIQFVVTLIVPYAFLSFFPASLLLEKGFGAKIMWFVPIVSICSIYLSIKLFRKGLSLYESVGN